MRAFEIKLSEDYTNNKTLKFKNKIDKEKVLKVIHKISSKTDKAFSLDIELEHCNSIKQEFSDLEKYLQEKYIRQ